MGSNPTPSASAAPDFFSLFAKVGSFGPMVGRPAARQEWDRIVGELISKGVLSAFDRGPLAAYCIAYALAMEAAEMVQKHGAMLKSLNGFPMQSPYLSQLNKQIDTMVRIASEFGFTPASRSRIFSFDQKNSLLLENIETDVGELRSYPELTSSVVLGDKEENAGR